MNLKRRLTTYFETPDLNRLAGDVEWGRLRPIGGRRNAVVTPIANLNDSTSIDIYDTVPLTVRQLSVDSEQSQYSIHAPPCSEANALSSRHLSSSNKEDSCSATQHVDVTS